tara:strand:+ start:240 stop:413 length:174 start_codon:yes stop_codon:yes gene_type:complete
MSTIFSIIGILCLIFAVGAIDGGYNGLPVNDNWTMFFIFTVVGIISMLLAIKSQEND